MKTCTKPHIAKSFVHLFFICCFTALPLFSFAQLSTDALFAEARKAAFNEKNYPKAIEFSKKALEKSPDYAEIRIFLGRVYTWADKPDSARLQLKQVLNQNPKNEDALQASFDVEYWNKQYYSALTFAEKGREFYPASAQFTLDEAKALRALGRVTEAFRLTTNFLANYPDNKAAADLLAGLKDELMVNKVGLSYDFINFDKRFSDPWHLLGFSFSRQNKWGTAGLSLNYANRFKKNATELELETYPSIAKGLYAYVGGGASLSEYGLFAKYRMGFSLYKSLPNSFEVEGGMRYLRFSEGTTIYVVGLGKYVKNTFINLRSYLSPKNVGWSKSFNLSGKVYLSESRYDYFGFNVGTGISPDDQAQLLNVVDQLKTFKAGLDYSRNINKKTTLSLSASWINEEYLPGTYGNQFGASISFLKWFR